LIQGAPLAVLGFFVALLLAAVAVKRSAWLAAMVTGIGFLTALGVMPLSMHGVAMGSGNFDFSGATYGFWAVILSVGFLLCVMAAGYWRGAKNLPAEEFFILLLVGSLGACVLVAAKNFLFLFLGLEAMTLAMIGMIAYPRHRPEAGEAGIKYLILSAMSSAFLLFGMGLLELATGSLGLADVLAASKIPMVVAGLAMMGVAVGFKLSVVPFHIWVPDVYAGAPAPAGAFLAVVPKLAVLAVLLRVAGLPGAALGAGAEHVVSVVAALSMLAGNLLALQQQNVKRILGFSSIAHLGYLLVAILAAGEVGRVAVVFYAVTYALTMVAAFGVLAVLSSAGAARDVETLADLRGLFWSRPALAAVMTLALLSLAGMPPAIGFIAKMYIFAAGVHQELWWLVGTMIASSVIGLFYYLSVILAMAQRQSSAPAASGMQAGGRFVLGVVSLALLVLGVAPEPLIALVKAMIG
jgi:NADH-quinone oxidoreductase subunit N